MCAQKRKREGVKRARLRRQQPQQPHAEPRPDRRMISLQLSEKAKTVPSATATTASASAATITAAAATAVAIDPTDPETVKQCAPARKRRQSGGQAAWPELEFGSRVVGSVARLCLPSVLVLSSFPPPSFSCRTSGGGGKAKLTPKLKTFQYTTSTTVLGTTSAKLRPKVYNTSSVSSDTSGTSSDLKRKIFSLLF